MKQQAISHTSAMPIRGRAEAVFHAATHHSIACTRLNTPRSAIRRLAQPIESHLEKPVIPTQGLQPRMILSVGGQAMEVTEFPPARATKRGLCEAP